MFRTVCTHDTSARRAQPCRRTRRNPGAADHPDGRAGPDRPGVARVGRARMGPASRRTNGQAVLLVLIGAGSIQFGAAFAAKLFPRVGPEGAVTLRLVIAAIVMLAAVRPKIRGRSRADLLTVVGLGVSLGGMNLCFYEAIARLPLGPAVHAGIPRTARTRGRPVPAAARHVLGGAGRGRRPAARQGRVLRARRRGCRVSSSPRRARSGPRTSWSRRAPRRRFTGVDGLALAMGGRGSARHAVRYRGRRNGPRAAGHVSGLGLVVALMSPVVPYSCEMLRDAGPVGRAMRSDCWQASNPRSPRRPGSSCSTRAWHGSRSAASPWSWQQAPG
ncbi:EamA family transporter [Yinghuangia aomiensis]